MRFLLFLALCAVALSTARAVFPFEEELLAGESSLVPTLSDIEEVESMYDDPSDGSDFEELDNEDHPASHLLAALRDAADLVGETHAELSSNDEEGDEDEDEDEEEAAALNAAQGLEQDDEAEESEDLEEEPIPDDEDPTKGDNAAVIGPNGPTDSDPVPDVQGLPSGMASVDPAEEEKIEQEKTPIRRLTPEKPQQEEEGQVTSEANEESAVANSEQNQEEVNTVFKGAQQAAEKPEEAAEETKQEKQVPWAVQAQLKELRKQNSVLKELLNRAVVSEQRLTEIVRADEGKPVTGFNKVFQDNRNAAKGEFKAPSQEIQVGGVTAAIEEGTQDAEDAEEEAETISEIQAESDDDYDQILSAISA